MKVMISIFESWYTEQMENGKGDNDVIKNIWKEIQAFIAGYIKAFHLLTEILLKSDKACYPFTKDAIHEGNGE